MFRGLREYLRYQLDDIFSRSSSSQFVVLVLLSVIVVLLGMMAVFVGLFSPENAGVEGIRTDIDRGFWDSLWWSLKHLFDPGFFQDNYGATAPVAIVSALISVMGMVIFGILIGFISTSMEARLASLQKGNSPVKERDHTLILGWSNKIVPILRLLAQTGGGLRVVVLAPRDIGQMQETLRAAGIAGLRLKVILRSGSPSNIVELKRVAFDQARSIIVLAAGERDADDSGRDVAAIKTLMLLSSFAAWIGARPVLVSEINRRQNLEIAKIAGRDEVSIVSSSEVIGRIIVQSARQKGLSFVYSEMLSAHGNSIYVRSVSGCTGQRFGDIQYAFADAIPIGVSWRKEDQGVVRYAAGLNPEPDYVVAADDQLVLLARTGRITHDPNAQPHTSQIARPEKHRKQPLRRILILGFNDNVHDILHEFDGHVGPGAQIDLVSNYRQEEAGERLNRHTTRPLRNVEIGCRRGDTVSAGFFRSLEPLSYDCIITLADESHGDDPDARSVMLLLLLSDALRALPAAESIQVVSEIIDPSNRELVARTAAKEIVVSPEIVSMQLSQISQQRVLASIYTELLSAGGTEIGLKPASRYVELGKPCTFKDLQYSAQAMVEVALGVRISNGAGRAAEGARVELNPARDKVWHFGPEDSVVVLAQEIYD